MSRSLLGKALVAAAGVAALLGAVPANAAPAHATVHLPHTLHAGDFWGGYSIHHGGTTVTASWVNPSVQCSVDGDNSLWAGFDGADISNTVEQIGIDLDCRSGVPSFHPWVEMYPGPSDYFKDTVNAGDTLTASVTVSGSAWTLTESDTTTGWTKTFHRRKSAQELSAEAIIEDIGGAPPVPDFNTVTFSNITVNGSPLASVGTVHKTTLQRGSTFLSKESPLSGGTFSITWLHS
jgi:hypothetical protein